MTKIVRAVIEGELGVIDNTEQMVDLRSGLLHFEPYVGIDRPTLNELFKEENNAIPSDKFLYDIAECVHKNTEYIVELFKPRPLRLANLMDRAPPGDVHKVVRVIQLWREENAAEATIHNLRKTFDRFSIFASRNPLELFSL